jgi:hypothetical protein
MNVDESGADDQASRVEFLGADDASATLVDSDNAPIRDRYVGRKRLTV